MFMFPGQGSQYVDMARGLYETEAMFRRAGVDCVRVETGKDYIVPLSVFFRARAKRR